MFIFCYICISILTINIVDIFKKFGGKFTVLSLQSKHCVVHDVTTFVGVPFIYWRSRLLRVALDHHDQTIFWFWRFFVILKFISLLFVWDPANKISKRVSDLCCNTDLNVFKSDSCLEAKRGLLSPRW